MRGWWKDTGQLADMLEANRLVLEELETKLEGEIDEESRVEGRVVVEEGASLTRSVVRGPAVIGAGACIEDAYIGPYTSIGDGVHVRRSEVEHSIILADSVVEDLETRMEASLLGRNVKLTRSDGPTEDFAAVGRRQLRDQNRLAVAPFGPFGYYSGHMAKQVTATDAKATILRLLDDAAAGEEIEITRYGRPVARLVPPAGARSLKGSFQGVAMTAVDEEKLFSTGEPWNAS